MYNFRILIVPLNHDDKEEHLFDILLEIFQHPDSLKKHNTNIYWEFIPRFQNNNKLINNRKLGIEDNILLALFEMILYMIVQKDKRLRDVIYEGVGNKEPDDDKYKNITILEKASNVAKASQAIINLRKGFDVNQINGYKLMNHLEQFDLDDLIDYRNDINFLNDYGNKLNILFDIIINIIKQNNNYNFIDLNFINYCLDMISPSIPLFDSRFYATDLKEYIKLIRDVSNSLYIYKHMKESQVYNAICCVGSAHADKLRELFIKIDVKSNIIRITDDIEELTIESVQTYLNDFISK